MTEFKVGDRVRLTGGKWGAPDEPPLGTVVEITRVNPAGTPVFTWAEMEWFIYYGYDAELVTDETPLTYGDLQTVGDLAKALGEPPRHIGLDYGLEKLDAIDPDHYKFPGGTEVIDIARHLGFLEGNVVKYVTRAGRKGDRLEDLKKAAQYLQWAIEDAEERA